MPPLQSTPSSPWLNRLLGATVLVSAWLLFQVQPMVAKRLLPWFGGGTAIWTTAMLFFQSALLLGYLYAHVVARRLAPRRQAALHAVVLLAAVAIVIAVGVVPGERWIPATNAHPAGRILVTLAACVGLPYLALAATAPLVQVWFARVNPNRSPYRLYALSNFGSLAALVSYPLVVEPNFGLAHQAIAWSALFAAFAAMCAASAYLTLRTSETNQPPVKAPAAARAPASSAPARPPALQQFFWIALPACASIILLSVTTYLCQDVASIPLLWIAPMVIYLVSFILTFDSDRWYRRWLWLAVLAVGSFAAVTAWHLDEELSWQWLAAAHLLLLLGVAVVCHGELARMRPAANRLTAFYLSISAGGALGGFLTGVVAPLVLSDFYELPLGIIAAWLLAMLALVTDRSSRFYDGRAFKSLLAMNALLITLMIGMWTELRRARTNLVAVERNFYGSLRVREIGADVPGGYRKLTNGHISHGVQFLAPENRRFPAQYYYPATGVGQLLAAPHTAPRRVGVVGLGAGTLAVYADARDRFTFYEINPQVIDFADKFFTYLSDARDRFATITIVEGDARLSLESADPQNFDVLVLDAFTSDAIPSHLLTREAFAIYLRHLRQPDGVLAVHISNRFIDLAPVVRAAVEHYKLEGRLVPAAADGTPPGSPSIWALVARPGAQLAGRTYSAPIELATKRAVIWTDDYNNIVELLKP
jgi:spermidine synthase